jgi:hypothetical protein
MNQPDFYPACRIAGAFVAAVLLGTTGCIVSGPPDALRHISAPSVVRAATRQDKLIAELQRPTLENHRYTAAEQIAVYAGYELDQGNEWDAAVLLSLASYRYHQQAHLALAIGESKSFTINPAVMEQYYEWVGHEVRMFNDQHFDHEIDLLRQHLFGFAVAAERRDAYLQEIARGGKEDAGFDQHLADLQSQMSNRPERLAHPALAKAFLARLVEDHRRDAKNNFAYYYLAATPLDSFRLAALDETRAAFDGVLVENLVPRLPALRSQVRQRLDDYRPYTRATAAAVLGLAPEPGDVAVLEARLAQETNALVIDSLRFALIRNGKHEHLARLVHHAGQKTAQEERDQSLTMLLWLPEEHKLTMDETLFVRLARSEPGISKLGRVLALAMLRDMAREKTLAQESVVAVLELTSDTEEDVARMASQAVSSLQQLGAAECKALYHRYPRARAALIERLGETASLADLDFLSRVYDDNAREIDVQMAAAGAVAAIPGTASLQLLRRWLAAAGRHEDVRPFLLLVSLLAMRADVAQANLDGLGLSYAKRLMIEMAVGGKEIARAAGVLEQSLLFGTGLDGLRLQDAAQIAILSGLLHRPAIAGTLWKLARYDNAQSYPADAMVRRHALGALVRIKLQRRVRGPERAVAGR